MLLLRSAGNHGDARSGGRFRISLLLPNLSMQGGEQSSLPAAPDLSAAIASHSSSLFLALPRLSLFLVSRSSSFPRDMAPAEEAH
ncbi:hypothetical protein EYF80_042033 [Liparis tanakae]|uniref:Uncharacterized protein n=1 Tax=Liparis tanakae TaxID=230148 RepID=A0A4Z2G3N3_9TELE|nr:hypothetical protein EYF80_042033 [Liparis tanakae]